MSASGAIIAVHLPAQSHVSTRSLWLALCSVWRAAMHTALQEESWMNFCRPVWTPKTALYVRWLVGAWPLERKSP